MVFMESRGAAAGVGRANRCTSTGGPHWASRRWRKWRMLLSFDY